MNNKNSRFPKWITVQSYKHDGALHRQWSPAFLVEETDQYWAVASKCSSVTEADGRKWMTREHAIFLLFKEKWMNVIAMFKPGKGICYYVNIASPTILDDEMLKYIDYDLDVKLYPDGAIKTLDEKEFDVHIQTYAYSNDLIKVIRSAKTEVERMIKEHQVPFDEAKITELYNKFEDINKPITNRSK